MRSCRCRPPIRESHYIRDGIVYAGCLCGATETRITPVSRVGIAAPPIPGKVGRDDRPCGNPECKNLVKASRQYCSKPCFYVIQAQRAKEWGAAGGRWRTREAECSCGKWFDYPVVKGKHAPRSCPECREKPQRYVRGSKGIAADSSRGAA